MRAAGLVGARPLLRPYARRLTGVDLSPAMVEQARQRQIYDALIVGELTAHLAAGTERYDLIASADTLVYFGDLRPLLAAAAQALRPGGLLVFTVEKAGPGVPAGRGFFLQHHGRYCHARGLRAERTGRGRAGRPGGGVRDSTPGVGPASRRTRGFGVQSGRQFFPLRKAYICSRCFCHLRISSRSRSRPGGQKPARTHSRPSRRWAKSLLTWA